jgi:hypothetical protein
LPKPGIVAETKSVIVANGIRSSGDTGNAGRGDCASVPNAADRRRSCSGSRLFAMRYATPRSSGPDHASLSPSGYSFRRLNRGPGRRSWQRNVTPNFGTGLTLAFDSRRRPTASDDRKVVPVSEGVIILDARSIRQRSFSKLPLPDFTDVCTGECPQV